ncbi:MAG: hypothetical protein GWO02_22725 [Gammaproteobacteria bacterium]|nr:hypothetical protein [Gammaproteobacteria bacterium]
MRAVLFGVLALAAGGAIAAEATAGEDEAWVESLMLTFQEHEPGIEPYLNRMVINGDYLFSGNPDDPGSYVLFDRNVRVIYSVSPGDRTILVIPPREVEVEAPMELRLGRERRPDADAPSVGGYAVTHYVFFANGRSCRDVVAAEGLLPEAVAAMREFQTVLAGEQASNLWKRPPEMQEPCGLANNIFAPVRHLEHGFPVLQKDHRGFSRALIEYDTEYAADPALFELPEDYQRYRVEDLTGAAP